MKYLIPVFLLSATLQAAAATFALNSVSTVVVPSTRGQANTTYYAWDTFTGNPGAPDFTAPINDNTPELGTNPGLALLVTNNGQDHISGSGNYYSSSGAVDETVTFDTTGTVGTGFTTLILQGVTAFGPFGTSITFNPINGVAPTVVQDLNAAGKGQFWAKWELPGNQDTYAGTLVSGANSFVSFDILSVDTHWDGGSYNLDVMQVPEPSAALLGLGALMGMLRRRRA